MDKITLSAGYDGNILKSGVFEALLEKSLPVVKFYRCDYYHDALWLSGGLPHRLEEGETFSFYYGARETGTSINADIELASSMLEYNSHSWKVTIKNENNKVTLSFKDIELLTNELHA